METGKIEQDHLEENNSVIKENVIEILLCECGNDVLIETERIPKDKKIPIYFVNEYETSLKIKPCYVICYLYANNVLWALNAKGSTILKVEYKFVEFGSPIFYQALKNSFLTKYNDDDTIDEENLKQDKKYISFCKDVVENILNNF